MTSRPLVWIALCFCLGIGIGAAFPTYFFIISLVTFLLIFLILYFCPRRLFFIFIFILFFGLGNLYVYSYTFLHQDHISYCAHFYKNKPIILKGVIVSDVTKKEIFNKVKTSFVLEVRLVESPWGWQKRNGKILVEIFRSPQVSYGDYVLIEGKLHRPFNFSQEQDRQARLSYPDYLARQGIQYILSVKKDGAMEVLKEGQGNYFRDLSFRLRDYLRALLARYLSKNEMGLMQAILLGDRSSIAPPLRDLFIHTGTVHILAISGLNVGIVATLFFVILKLIPVGHRLQILLTIFLLIIYGFLTGGSPSVVRATIMAVVFLGSFIVEKETNTFNSLCLAAFIILLMNPLNLFDAGFQLSFICVLAIIFIYPLLTRMIERKGEKSHPPDHPLVIEGFGDTLAKSFILSLAVWLAVAGLIAYYFNIVTPLTVIVNLFMIPLNFVIVILGFGLLFTGVFSVFWGGMFALALKLALNVMAGIIFLFDKIPYSYFYIKPLNLWVLVTYYLILGMITIFLWRRNRTLSNQ